LTFGFMIAVVVAGGVATPTRGASTAGGASAAVMEVVGYASII
jgi:hypothetical protein